MSRFFARHTRNIQGPDGVLLALRVVSLLTCLTVLYQATTTGEIFMRNEVRGKLDAYQAVAMYVLTGLTMIAAFVHRRVGAAPWWPSVVAAVVFALSFVLALVGQQSGLYVHVPLALALMIGATVVATWALTARPRPVSP